MTRWLRLDDHRDDHRPALVLTVDPAPDDAAYDLLELVGVGVAILHGAVEGVDEGLLDLVEGRVVLGEAAGVDLRAGGDLAADGVDDHDHRDEALLAEDPAVLQ